MEIDLDNSYNIDFSDVEKEYIFLFGVPCNTSLENQSDTQFENYLSKILITMFLQMKKTIHLLMKLINN